MTKTARHERRFFFTVDVDWIPGSEKGLRAIYDFCDEERLRGVFFFAGRFAEVYPETVRECVQRGHQVGTHGWEHGQKSKEDEENFRDAPIAQQEEWMRRSTEAVRAACGETPRAFRAPNLLVSEATFQVLAAQGYRFDSSVPARRFSVTYGSFNLPKYYWAPLEAYRPSTLFLAARGDSAVLEVPPSAFFVPLNMSALRVLGLKACRWATRRLAARSRDLTFFVHPSEFVPADQQQIPSINPKRHLEGLGPQNFEILRDYVRFVKSLQYSSVTFDAVEQSIDRRDH
jgi:hypothetical protein